MGYLIFKRRYVGCQSLLVIKIENRNWSQGGVQISGKPADWYLGVLLEILNLLVRLLLHLTPVLRERLNKIKNNGNIDTCGQI